MPAKWSNKDERQYKHIKQSAKQYGRGEERAAEIAARTVNKKRRVEGRVESKTSRATGNPNKSLSARTKAELYNRARLLKISGRSSMSKDELVKAIGRR
jgi:hypothetical protein